MIELHKLDVRTVERHIRKGTITRADYDKHLAALTDHGEDVEFVDYATQFREEEQAEAAAAAEAEANADVEVGEAEPAPAPGL